MKEIKSFIERAERYLRSAKLLLQDGDYASSISRSYYLMFYLAEALLLTKNLSFSSHQGVISAFGKNFVKTGIFEKEFSKILAQSFEKRQLAEYETGLEISQEETEELLNKAEKFLKKARKYLEKN